MQIDPKKLLVYAGAHIASKVETSSDVQKALVSKTIIHPKFMRKTLSHDFMILKLDRDIKESKAVKYVRLPNTDGFPPASRECTFVGWGKVKEKAPASDVLMKGGARVNPHSTDEVSAFI